MRLQQQHVASTSLLNSQACAGKWSSEEKGLWARTLMHLALKIPSGNNCDLSGETVILLIKRAVAAGADVLRAALLGLHAAVS